MRDHRPTLSILRKAAGAATTQRVLLKARRANLPSRGLLDVLPWPNRPFTTKVSPPESRDNLPEIYN